MTSSTTLPFNRSSRLTVLKQFVGKKLPQIVDEIQMNSKGKTQLYAGFRCLGTTEAPLTSDLRLDDSENVIERHVLLAGGRDWGKYEVVVASPEQSRREPKDDCLMGISLYGRDSVLAPDF